MPKPSGQWIDKGVLVICLVMVLYHLAHTQYPLVQPVMHQNIHYGLALVIVFLAAVRQTSKAWQPLMWFLLVASVVAAAYVAINYDELIMTRGPTYSHTVADLVIGVILIVTGLEATRRIFGPVLPVIALIAVLYAYFGHFIPGVLFRTSVIPLEKLISVYAIGLLGGLWGTVLGISANYIFLFVLIGGVLQVSRARDFFLGVGKLAGRRLAGGPALTAVVSSGLMGSVSGSSMANVAITGSFTIPMMKKVGYQPYQAGAIEAGASTGGQIMPPVMGAAAFAMAGLLGVPYWNIVVAAVVPAILYFIAVGAYAQFQGAKLGVASTQGKVELKQLLLDAPLFLAPFLVLIVLLSQGYSPMFSIFWGILGVVITAVALGLVTKQWVPVKQWLDAIAAGAKTGAGIAATSAAIGLVMSTLTMTGLGIKLPSMVIEFSGGNLVIALIITMVAAIVLGMGVPTLAAYILAALVCAPALYQLGVSLFAAHLFVLFFAVFSCVTPPVAVAALVASSIAGSSYLRTALETVKVCLAGFLLPYIMIFAPGIIMQNPSVASTVLAIVISLISFISAASAIVGYGIAPLSLAERVMIGAVSILLLAYLLTKFLPLLFVGLVIFITVGFLQWRKQKYTRRKEPLGLA